MMTSTCSSFPNLLRLPRTIFALLLAVSLGGMLHAQNTSPLDTAPGGATAPAVTPQTQTSPAAPTSTPAPPPEVSGTAEPDSPPAASIVSNGDFELATKDPSWPDDWGRDKDNAISWQEESGKHFLRLVSPAPGKMVMAYREVHIPPGVKGLNFSARYRTAGIQPGAKPWFDARAVFHFLDASRKQVKPDPSPVSFSAKAADWTEAHARFMVPEGATTLVLMPALFQVTAGTLDLAEIEVTPLSAETAEAMAAEAAARAQREAEQQATLAQEMALPATTHELKVSGNQIVTGDGTAVWLQGVNVVPLGWDANGEGKVLWSMHVALNDWKANVIRLPVQDSFWFGRGRAGMTNNQDAYRALVDSAVKLAAAHGAYLILDLHRFLTPDASCVEFWKDAAAHYKDNPAVLFDIFNEPHDTTWEVWRNGGPVQMKGKNPVTVQSVGMQALVDAVRSTGAKNIILAGGLGYAYDLSGILNGYALDDKGGNGIMYATHFYNWQKGWEKHILDVAAKYPVHVGETGADIHKMPFIPANEQEDPYTWAPDAIGFIQKYHLNWTAWAFHTKATPDLLLDWNYTPTPYWGAFVKDALSGKQFTMTHAR